MFSTKFFSFTDEHRAIPVQDTTQRRHRRRRAVGTRFKDSFQITTLRKPFLLSLVDNIPRFSLSPRRRLASWHVAMPEFCTYLDTRGFLPRAFVQPVFIKTEYLRECSASRVWPYMHQLRIMSLVKCWVCPAPVFCCLTFRSIG